MRKFMLVLCVFALFVGCAHGVNTTGGSVFTVNDAAPDVESVDSGSEVADANPYPDGNFPPGSFDLGEPETLPIDYWGGPVLTQPINVYFIWYGNWTDTKTAPILEDLIRGMGTSPWWQISASYFQQPTDIIQDAGIEFGGDNKRHAHRTFLASADGGSPQLDAGVADAAVDSGSDASPEPDGVVSGTVNFVRGISVGYPLGNELGDDDITTIVTQATASALPLDPNGVYFVLTSADVSETSGFCWEYCGWHGNVTINGVDVKLAYIGDTGACTQGCSLQDEYQQYGIQNSPNGDWSADSMASVMAHELSESATDPDVNSNIAWLDEEGDEIADKCAWTFGSVYHTDAGSVANVNIGGRDFMIQQDWVMAGPDGGYCGLHP